MFAMLQAWEKEKNLSPRQHSNLKVISSISVGVSFFSSFHALDI